MSGSSDDAMAEPLPVQSLATPDRAYSNPQRPTPQRPGRRASAAPRSHADGTNARHRAGVLRQAIESEVLPRMAMALPRRGAPAETCSLEADALATLAIEPSPIACFAAIEAASAAGVAPARIHLDLLAPAARRLGQMWVDDTASFADVTLGTWRLQQAMHRLAAEFPPVTPPRRDPRRVALVVPLPGEQHGFGAAMVGEFLRRAGWDVDGERAATVDALVARVAEGWFALVGLSIGGDALLPDVARTIRRLRRASRNPELGVMVGGNAFNARPELALQVGADAAAADAETAVRRAEDLLRRCAAPV